MKYSVGIIIISDRAFSGERKDGSLEIFQTLLKDRFKIQETIIVNDDAPMIENAICSFVENNYNLILTSGGTGCANRDNTPEVTSKLLDKPTPGVSEAIRSFSQTKSSYAMYSRAVSGIIKNSFIINLPGSPKAVQEILGFLLNTIEHPLKLLQNQIDDCQEELKNEEL